MFEPFSLDSMYYYHQQKIEDFIDELADADDPNDEATQYAVARATDLDFNKLTAYDIDYIEKEVAKRWQK